MNHQNNRKFILFLSIVSIVANTAWGQSTWTNPAGGVWSDSSQWSPMIVPNGATEAVTLPTLSIPYTVELDQSTLLYSLAVNSSATMSIHTGPDLLVGAGGVHNQGTISIGGSGTNTTSLAFFDDAMIDGVGFIDLDAVGNPRYAAVRIDTFDTTLTIGSSQTITGTGEIRSLSSTAGSLIVLNGTVNANREGFDILLNGEIDASNGGMFMGTNGGEVAVRGHLTGGTLLGGVYGLSTGMFDGTLAIGDNGVRQGTTWCVGDGLTNEGYFLMRGGTSLRLSGPHALINNGQISVNDIVGIGTRIEVADNAAIQGIGIIELNGAESGAYASIRVDIPDTVLTIGPGQTITGSGNIVAGGAGSSIILNGMINADRKGELLYARGLIDASGGGVLVGTNGGTVAMGGDLIEGTIAGNVYGVLPTSYSGTVATGTNGVAVGAFTTVCVDNGLTNLGDFEVGSDLELRGHTALRNYGTVALNDGRLLAGVDAEVHGTGMIELNSTGQTGSVGIFIIQADATLTIHEDQAITGTGEFRINSSDSNLVVLGSIAPGGVNNEIRMLGNIDFGSTTTLKIDIGGPDIQHFDRLTGESILNLDGSLELELANGYQPNAGDSFTIVRADQINGSFSQVISPTIGIQRFYLVQTTNTIDAVWTCRTDFTGDGILDVFDVFAFIDAFMTANSSTDFTNDGIYDIFDVIAFLKEFTTGCP